MCHLKSSPGFEVSESDDWTDESDSSVVSVISLDLEGKVSKNRYSLRRLETKWAKDIFCKKRSELKPREFKRLRVQPLAVESEDDAHLISQLQYSSGLDDGLEEEEEGEE